MAKLIGRVFRVQGTIDNVTFYQTKEGIFERSKSSINPERIKKDPAFQRTRENGQEFGHAAKAGKLIRHAVQPLTRGDARVSGRLQKKMMECLRVDTTNQRGKRTVTDGDLSLLNGFDFNIDRTFSSTFHAPFTPYIDRTTGTLNVMIPGFQPANYINGPVGATHFQLSIVGAQLDFASELFENGRSESAMLPLDNTSTQPITLSTTLQPASSLSMFIALDIRFFSQTNGVYYPLAGNNNATSIVAVAR